MMEALPSETLSRPDEVEADCEPDDLKSELAAHLVFAKSQSIELGNLVRLEHEGAYWAVAVAFLGLLALAAVVVTGMGFLESAPMAPLFLAPILWQAATASLQKWGHARRLLFLQAQLDTSIRIAEHSSLQAASSAA